MGFQSTANSFPQEEIDRILQAAWEKVAHALGTSTKVGAAALAPDGTVYTGCNIGHKFHSHDIHAEIGAISSLVAGGHKRATAIAVVSELPGLTPCGSCLDWILQLGGSDCLVYWQSYQNGPVTCRRAGDLMPFAPQYYGDKHE